MKLPHIAFLALSLARAAPLRAQTPAPTPDPDKDPPRFADTVDVEAELPALPPSSSAATRTARAPSRTCR